MNIYCEQLENCTVVKIEGDLSVPETDKFKDFIMAKIRSGATDYVLDFAKVPYIDSSGISVILKLVQVTRRKGGDIRLANLNDRIEKLFDQVGLQHVFRWFDSVGDGVVSFAAAGAADTIESNRHK